jgi:hypothetical protein
MLLRRFAEDDQIATVDRVNGKVRVGRTSETALVKGFYEYVDKDGVVKDDLEDELAKLEGSVEVVLRKLHEPGSMRLSVSDREILSTFVAVQFLRTPVFRRATELLTENLFKQEIASRITDEDSARASFRAAGIDPTENNVEYLLAAVESGMADFEVRPHPNDYFQHFFLWPRLSEKLSKREIRIRTFPAGSLILSDHPVLFVHQLEAGLYESDGIENSGEVWFPISSNKLLIFSSPSIKMRQHGDSTMKYGLNPETHNYAQILQSSEYYFGPPSLIGRMKNEALGKRIFVEVPGRFSSNGLGLEEFDPKPIRLSSFEKHAPHPHPAPPKAP